MKIGFFKKFIAVSSVIFVANAFARSKPLYKLPETLPEPVPEQKEKEIVDDVPFLLGTDSGLFRIASNGLVENLWTNGKVEKIIKTKSKWYFLTQKGIVVSHDLATFEERNSGLPNLVVKKFDSQSRQKTLVQQTPLLKDLCADPFDEDILVTATKDEVFITRDGGNQWKSIGSTSRRTAGMKAVAVTHIEDEVVVFMSHPIYGFSYYRADSSNPKWNDVSYGLSAMKSMTQIDEISDILPIVSVDAEGKYFAEVYLAQSFLPNIYKFNWETKKCEKIYNGTEAADTIDGLTQCGSKILFSRVGGLAELSLKDYSVSDVENFGSWKSRLELPQSVTNTAYIPASVTGYDMPIEISELWMMNPDKVNTPYGDVANKKKSVYASVYQLRNMEGINKYKKIVKDNKLNSVVIDMKDDYGLLRFEPQNPMLRQKGTVTQYKVDVDTLVSEFKKDNIYLIARIVVFKDKNLSTYDKKQYAVWNSRTNSQWVGIKGTEDIVDDDGKVAGTKTLYYDEHWVDPYSEEVWEYNVEIAKELVARGFDEIQFDYIRFPTDGTNLGLSQYRWRDKGMDKESALVSFLSYARENIKAPIGIDIYGANGWYRSGTRTGQDVELMSDYVDIICPMFYPSHFEQNFLDYSPYEERPYRIFFYGSYRNTVIGRNKIIVRPWIQAFYMGVRYDRQYYGKNYVLREVFGVRDGLDRGYMYWNNSGKWYEDISPDPQDNEISPWHANECDLQQRIPAFGSGKKSGGSEQNSGITPEDLKKEKERNDEMISIWNSVLEQERNDYQGSVTKSRNFLMIEPFGSPSEF